MDYAPGMSDQTKQRSPYVRVWLITMMLLNILGALANLVRTGAREADLPGASPSAFLVLGALSVANLGFLVMIWRWRRRGFYALGVSTLVAVAVNVFIGMPGQEPTAWSRLD
jgi:hypothetical protein